MATGTRLAIVAAVALSVTAYMAYVGAASSWQYYVTVDECVANSARLINDRIRVSGVIAPSSLRIDEDRAAATFVLAGRNSDLQVSCAGLLPDNLAEGSQVVVEGQMKSAGFLVGHKLLSRCASKYTSQRTVSRDSQDRYESQGS